MNNAKIDYIHIIKGLQAQFDAVLEYAKDSGNIDDEEAYVELKTINNIKVADEQYFVKKVDFNPNNIYIAVKFGSATVNFASSVMSISFRIMATENKIKPTQLILGQFVTMYNLQPLYFWDEELQQFEPDSSITQVWQTPTVASNFNPTSKAFRTLFSMSGVMVVGQDTVDIESIKYIYVDPETHQEVSEDIAVMSFDEGYQASSNPQPFGNSYGFAKSEINFGTDALTFSTYLLDTQLLADCMHARGLVGGANSKPSTKGKNDIFKFEIKYTNGFSNETISFFKEYRLISYRIGKKVGDIPSFVVSFSY